MTTKTGVYLHKKGNKYYVQGVATVATNGAGNGAKVVVYTSLTSGEVFVRDEAEFNEPGRFTFESDK